MKLLRINESNGEFYSSSDEYVHIDKITKEDILMLVNRTLREETIELDPYDVQAIKNHAHQLIYKSVYQKLQDLQNRRQEFVDESKRLFLEDYERYRQFQ